MTIEALLQVACMVSMGIMTGIYVNFSNAMMPTFKEIENGAEIMVTVNDFIVNPPFKILFFLSAISSAYLAFFASDIDPVFRIGCSLFFVGTFMVTVLRNVPLNNALRQSVVTQKCVAEVWQGYLRQWVRWNHLRSLSGLAALTLTVLSNH